MGAEENGKISWYEAIKESLSDIRDDIREIKDVQKEQAKTLNQISIEVGTHGTAIDTNCKEIEKLRSATNIKESITGIGTLIAMVLGAIGINK